jgi:LacI family transcriptional regulator
VTDNILNDSVTVTQMDRANITIGDVAKRAGVSKMTVSRAINNKGEITEATRLRILEVAAELGYRPSRVARGLATKKTMQLGLVVPDITNPFFSRIALGAQSAAWDHEYNVLLLNTMEQTEREQQILHLLEESQVDGVILCSPRLPDEQLNNLLAKQQSIVVINRQVVEDRAGVIYVDDRGGAIQAVRHLVGRDRKKIGLLAGPANSVSGKHRVAGYITAYQETGLPYNTQWQISCEPTHKGGERAAHTLFAEFPDIDGLLCYNDMVAVGALRACHALQRRVPADVAVIGFDDILLASISNPGLTTLHVSKYDIGVAAFNMLLARMNGEHSQAAIVFDQQLVLRESAP